MRSRLLPLLAVSTLAVLAAACTKTLDTSDIQPELERYLTTNYPGIEAPSVTCPDNVKVQEGATFTCTGSDPTGVVFTFAITQKDDQGNVSFRVSDIQGDGASALPPVPSSTP